MKKLLQATFLLLNFIVNSQNYINNADFETPDPNNLDDNTRWPDGPAQADKLSSWETRTFKFPSGNTHHSPDWIHKRGINTMSDFQSTLGSPPPANAQNGKGMIGMFNYELIQNYFNQSNPLQPETYHTLSMWVYIPNNANVNCKLRIMFAKNKLKYKSENLETDICNEDYITYKDGSNTFTTIHEFDFANLNLTKNNWQKISTTFKTPKNTILNQYDFFVMELRKNNYTGTGVVNAFSCNDSYIFIDNLSLVKSSFCSANCAPNLGDIEIGNIPNALAQTTSFLFTVKNAIGIEFRIFDSFGGEIDFEDAFDPNGLRDIGYPDYQFGWNSPGLQEDVYNFTLKIWNCGYTKNITGSILIFNNGSPPTSGFNVKNFELFDCCPLETRVQNFTYTENKVEKAKNDIYAGANVSIAPPGPVIVSTGTNVKYIAKNIYIQPGFIVQPGASFKIVTTEDCTYEGLRIIKKDRRKPIENDFKQNDEIPFERSEEIIVFPNPSYRFFNFLSLKSKIVQLDLYNNLGQAIISNNKINDKCVIDLNDFNAGTYHYKVKLEDGTERNGKLIRY